jgi:hypothetical protein
MFLQELPCCGHDFRKQKQRLIAENLPLTESETVKFWHVYQQYSDELKAINDEKFAMIHAYAQSWPSMSNDDAFIFIWRWLEVDEKVVQLRSKYVPLVKDTLPGKKAAAFFQLDERISMMIDLEFASQMPLLHGRLKKNKPPRPCTRFRYAKSPYGGGFQTMNRLIYYFADDVLPQILKQRFDISEARRIGGGDLFYGVPVGRTDLRGGVASDAASDIILDGSELSKMTGWRAWLPNTAFARFSKLLQSYR